MSGSAKTLGHMMRVAGVILCLLYIGETTFWTLSARTAVQSSRSTGLTNETVWQAAHVGITIPVSFFAKMTELSREPGHVSSREDPLTSLVLFGLVAAAAGVTAYSASLLRRSQG